MKIKFNQTGRALGNKEDVRIRTTASIILPRSLAIQQLTTHRPVGRSGRGHARLLPEEETIAGDGKRISLSFNDPEKFGEPWWDLRDGVGLGRFLHGFTRRELS